MDKIKSIRRVTGVFGRAKVLVLIGMLAGVVSLISCAGLSRTIVAPPHIPGAEFVGSESCAQCHENLTKDFHTATHARILSRSAEAMNMGCESCHGGGSLHVETGGAPNTIVNPRQSPQTCFECHLDMRGRFNLPYTHPILAGTLSHPTLAGSKMSCTECHDPHRGSAIKGGGTALASLNDTCIKCHTAQRGPFVFEHEATREGCTTCHNPHGSVNAKLLTERGSNLCLKCHAQQQTAPGQIFIGGVNHTAFLTRGSCWTAGCHEAVHGSHVNSSLRY
jgi:predicted CXXCH cytochrome family protein